MSKNKNLLTLEQLASFCKKNKLYKFSSEESGYKLAVQVPGNLLFTNDTNDLMFVKVKVCHTLLNRNGSYISEDNMKKAMNTLAYKPLLGSIITNDDGELDFNGHDMEFVENENGEMEVQYIEKQIGTFTTDEPYLEYDEDEDKTYVMATAVIPMEYTKACDIIKRKNGTKVSCELVINEMQYNAKSKYLEILDFYFQGVACLGEHVGEGMKGSRLDIKDFSVENNSIHYSIDEKLIDVLDRLNNTLSNFNINENQGKEEPLLKSEEILVNDEAFEEVVDKDTEEVSQEVTEEMAEQSTDEEVSETVTENESEETETPDVVENEAEVVETEACGKKKKCNEEDEVEIEVTETEACGKKKKCEEEENDETPEVIETEACGKKKKCSIELEGRNVQEFEVSLDEKIYAIESLVNTMYCEADNDYYTAKVYDKYVVMMGFWSGRCYRQSYETVDNSYTLVGERVEVFAQFLSDEEIKALESLKSSYSSIQEKLSKYELEEQRADKMKVFEDEAYSNYLETEEFVALMSLDTIDAYSKEELQEKADATLGKLVKVNKTFSYAEKPQTINKVSMPVKEQVFEEKPYGNLFD